MNSLYCVHKLIATECARCKSPLKFRCLLCFQEQWEATGPRFRTKCRISKGSPLLSLEHKFDKDPDTAEQLSHLSPKCLLCGKTKYGGKREETECVDSSTNHSLRPYPFRCDECKGLVFLFGEKDIRASICERTWTGQHVIPIKGMVGKEVVHPIPNVDADSKAYIESTLKSMSRSWRTRRNVWRSPNA